MYYLHAQVLQIINYWGGGAAREVKGTLPSLHIHYSPPIQIPPGTNAGMCSNFTVSGIAECDNSVAVWYCWNCARYEGSNPCSRKLAMNTRTTPLQHHTFKSANSVEHNQLILIVNQACSVICRLHQCQPSSNRPTLLSRAEIKVVIKEQCQWHL